MRILGLILLFFGGILTGASRAQAVSLIALAGYSYPNAMIQAGTGHTYSMHSQVLGYGALFGFKMFPRTMAQLGAMYFQRGFKESDVSLASPREWTWTSYHIPFTFHYFFAPSMALGFGGYYAYSLGSVAISDSSGTSNIAFGPTAYSVDDWGWVASLSIRLTLIPYFTVVGEGRYMMSTKNVSNISGFDVKLNDMMAFVGIQLGR